MLKQILGIGLVPALTLTTGFAQADPDDRGPFELQPMIGYSWINLTGFSEDKFLAAAPEVTAENAAELDVDAQANSMLDASQVPVDGQGLSAGLGAQLKFWVFVLGARYAYTHTPDFGLHTVGGDLGMRVGGKVALYGRAGLGLAFVSGLPDNLNTRGYTVGIGGGLDIRPSDAISFGFGVDGDALLMSSTSQLNSAAQVASGGSVSQDTASEIDGSAFGYQIRPQIHLTWHL